MLKKPPVNAEDTGNESSVPGLGRSPRGGNGSPLQDSCLKNPMKREAWWATVHGGRTELDTTEQLRTCTHTHTHTHKHTHQCSLLLQTSGGNHGALSINSAPVINYRVDLGLERVRKASGPPLAGELLQSELESPPQGENVRFSPSRHAAWRGGWFILTPRHRFSFLTEHILV